MAKPNLKVVGGIELTEIMQQAITPETWAELIALQGNIERNLESAAQARQVSEKAAAEKAAYEAMPQEYRGIIDKCTELEQARIAKRKNAEWQWNGHVSAVRRQVAERLIKQMDVETPSITEMAEAVADFKRFRDFLQDRYLPIPDEHHAPELEDVFFFLASESERGSDHVESIRQNISRVLYAQNHPDVASDPAVRKLLENLRAKENEDGTEI